MKMSVETERNQREGKERKHWWCRVGSECIQRQRETGFTEPMWWFQSDKHHVIMFNTTIRYRTVFPRRLWTSQGQEPCHIFGSQDYNTVLDIKNGLSKCLLRTWTLKNSEQGILNNQYCDGSRQPRGTIEKRSLLLEEESVMSYRLHRQVKRKGSNMSVPGTPWALTLPIHHDTHRRVLHMKLKAREAMGQDQLDSK